MSMRGAGRLGWVCAACALAACGTDDAPPAPAAAGSSSAPSPVDDRGGAAADRDDSSRAGQGGADSELPIGELAGASYVEPGGGAPSNPPLLCDPQASWGEPRALSGISTDADERLLAMSHDELTLVFTRDDALLIAERSSPDAELGAGEPLALPPGYSAERGLALSADGTSLVFVDEGGLSFAELTRSERGVAFGLALSTQRFAYVNDARSFSGGELSSPVLSEDGVTFFYVQQGAGRSDVWRADGASPFSVRTPLDPVIFGGEEGEAKLTLSVSVDERTLFVFDGALGHAVGLWSATPAAELTRAMTLPGLESAFSNARCTRLYGTAAGDVVVEQVE